MTQAEEKALETYPVLFSERNKYDNPFDDRREAFVKGYEQAEKDIFEDSLKSDMTIFKKMQDHFIDKACEWLYSRQAIDLEVPNIDKFINDFRKAMEDKK